MKMAKIQIYRWYKKYTVCIQQNVVQLKVTIQIDLQINIVKKEITGFVLWKTVAVFNMSV